MHSIQSRLPCVELRSYVRAYAQREITGSLIDVVQSMPASLEGIIELDFANPPIVEYLNGAVKKATRTSIVGPGTYRSHSIRLPSPVDSFGIFFQPMGLRQLFGIPGPMLVNEEHSAIDVLGNGILHLWERMGQNKCFAARVRIVDEYLLQAAAQATVCTVVMACAGRIFRERGVMRVDSSASDAALSVRQYERRFLEEIGIPPKLFARITRCQMAMDAKLTRPNSSWLTIAHEFGYHDQMHMIKDFQKLNNDSPAGVLAQLGDMRPEALAAIASIL